MVAFGAQRHYRSVSLNDELCPTTDRTQRFERTDPTTPNRNVVAIPPALPRDWSRIDCAGMILKNGK